MKRWPASHELDLDDTLLNPSIPFSKKIDKVSKYIEKNIERFGIEELSDKTAGAKSLKSANDWKDRGNDHFKNKRWREAVDAYTQSIVRSPESTEALAIGFANRSAALFQLKNYEQAISDVTQAIESGYPSDKIFKLYYRRGTCYMETNQVQDALDDFLLCQTICTDLRESKTIEASIQSAKSKLVSLDNSQQDPSAEELTSGMNDIIINHSPLLHGAVDCVQVQSDEIVGRYLVTTRDVRAGEPLIREEPYVAALIHEQEIQRCHHCFLPVKRMVLCQQCSHVVFCSPECQKDASWYHGREWYSCELFLLIEFKSQNSFFIYAPTSLIVCTRILMRREMEADDGTAPAPKVAWAEATSPDEAVPPSVQTMPAFGPNYPSINSLVSHKEQLAPVYLNEHIFNALLAKYCLKKVLEIDVERLLHHLCQMKPNLYGVYDLVTRTSPQGNQTITQEKVAEAIYSTSSLLNHSCKQNTTLNYHGRWLTVRASENIEAGGEITNCYGPHAARMNYKQRHDALKRQYFFECRCITCLEESNVVVESYICQQCEVPLRQHSSKSFICRKCMTDYSFDTIQIQEEIATRHYSNGIAILDYLLEQDIQDEIRMQNGIDSFTACLGIRRSIYYKHHPKIGEVEDAMAHLYAIHEEYRLAAHHCQNSVEILKHSFGEESVEIGNEMAKLAQLLFNDQQLLEAMTTIENAKLILAKHYNKTTPMMQELEKMRKVLLEVIEKTVGPYWST